jgi:hypothetical protein
LGAIGFALSAIGIAFSVSAEKTLVIAFFIFAPFRAIVAVVISADLSRSTRAFMVAGCTFVLAALSAIILAG